MASDGISSLASRLVRGSFLVAASIASIATFGASPTWELHKQLEDDGSTSLSSALSSWSSDFKASGAGTGQRTLRFDGAVELTPSADLPAPVQVRLRFVPMGGGAMVEKTVFVTTTQVFTAVDQDVTCMSGTTCVNEGTLSLDVLDPSTLGNDTLAVHWVATSSLYGRGPAVPADGRVDLQQP